MQQVKTAIRKEKHSNETIDNIAKSIEQNSKNYDEALATNNGKFIFYINYAEDQILAKMDKMREILPEFDLKAKESSEIYNIKTSILTYYLNSN